MSASSLPGRIACLSLGCVALALLLLAVCGVVAVAPAGAVTFATHVDYATGAGAYTVAVGDFNGDGKLDLAVVDNGASKVSILLGNGNGTFAAKTDYTTGEAPYSVAVGDFNGDGKLDLVTSNAASTVSILLGHGDGTFAAKTDYTTGTYTNPYTVAVGDFNRDGKLDLVVANMSTSVNTVGILLGNGDGTFAAHTDYATGACPMWVAVGDLNGDGKLDLAVSNNNGVSVSILLGNGNGTFGAKTDYATPSWPQQIAIADVNADGKPDVVLAVSPSNVIRIMLGRGDGTFVVNSDFTTGLHPFSAAVGDFNGDGRLDLVSGNGDANTASVLLGYGNGSFAPKTDFATGSFPNSVATGDFNADGRPDLAVVNAHSDTVSVLLNTGTPPAGGFSLNGGATWSNSHSVTINSAVTGATQMRFCDQGGAWSDWETYAATKAWTLPAGDGSKTVQAQYCNNDGTISRSDSIGLDTTAPTTTDDAPLAWRTSGLTVHLTPSDGSGSGMTGGSAKTEYKLDGAPDWTAGTSIDVSGDGIHTILYRSTDAVGNLETPDRSCTVRINTTAPQTSDDAPSGWQDHTVTVTLTPSDGSGSGMTGGSAKTEYKLDGAPDWTAGTSIDVSGDGIHTILYRSTDAVGNLETPDRSCTVRIDTTAPQTSDDADALWHNTAVTVTLSPTDAGCGVLQTQYRVDGGAWRRGSSVAIAAPAGGANDGQHTIAYRSIDTLINVEDTRTCQVRIDATAPTTTDNANPGGMPIWLAGPWTLELSPSDPLAADGSHAGMTGGQAQTEYSTDGGLTWVSGTELNFTRWKRGGGSGIYTVLYRSTDAAGNAETPRSTTVQIDTTAPTSSCDVPGSPVAAPVTVHFVGSDAYSAVTEFWYSLDGGTWTEGTSVDVAALGDHTLAYYAIDAAGNVQVGYNVCTFTLTGEGSGSSIAAPIRARLTVRRGIPSARLGR